LLQGIQTDLLAVWSLGIFGSTPHDGGLENGGTVRGFLIDAHFNSFVPQPNGALKKVFGHRMGGKVIEKDSVEHSHVSLDRSEVSLLHSLFEFFGAHGFLLG
jgi:hypothetical protein